MDRKGGQEVSGGEGMWGEKRGEQGKRSRREEQAHSDRVPSVSPRGSSVESLGRETKRRNIEVTTPWLSLISLSLRGPAQRPSGMS